MAPTLRNRKTTAAAAPATPKPATPKLATKGKRKAADENTPSVTKKAKVSSEKEDIPKQSTPKKETPKATPPTPSKKNTAATPKESTPKAPEPAAKLMDIEEDSATANLAIQDEDAEQEVDAELQALAADLDPESESKDVSTFTTGQDVGTIPTPNGKKNKASSKEEPGVVYIGRVPHGFYENEMKQYFSQFGPILRLRMSRNKRTGASKHFAFIEFSEASTAEIVAKTMDNYLLFGHILKCKVVPKEKLHEDVWKGANKRFKRIPYNKMEGLMLRKPKSENKWAHKIARENAKRAEKAKKLKALGYHFKPVVVKTAPTPGTLTNRDVQADKQQEEPKAIKALIVEEQPKEEKEKKTKNTRKTTKKAVEEPVKEKENLPEENVEEPVEKKPVRKTRAKAQPKVPVKPTRSSTRNKKPVA